MIVTIPAATDPGAHSIQVVDTIVALNVDAAPAALASTGNDLSVLYGGAGLVLLAGLALFGSTVRRRRA